MNPFDFTKAGRAAADELLRFEQAAAAWKPIGFNEEADLRLTYYLDRPLADLKKELQRRFPNTHEDMVPSALPLVRSFVKEQARVFLGETTLPLVKERKPGEDPAPRRDGEEPEDGEEPADDDSDEVPLEPRDPVAKMWAKAVERGGLPLRLKQVDRYTWLLRTCFLKVARVGKAVAFQIYFPQVVEIAFDPAAPFDLDRAYGVRIEIGTDEGLNPKASPVKDAKGEPIPPTRRFEFYCARPGEERFVVVDSTGAIHAGLDDKGAPGAYPFVRPDGTAAVPLVMFTAHTEELGPFTLAGESLVKNARAAMVLDTDIQHIAEANGFGQMVVTTALGSTPPTSIVRGPNRAIMLGEGNTADIKSGNAAIGDLIALLDSKLKRLAVLEGIPAGAVSLEARATASGVALQIEMRPLLEARQDAAELYAGPLLRLWDVFAAVHNATRDEGGEPAIPAGIGMRWRPAPVVMPTDPKAEIDAAVFEVQNDLLTTAGALARLRRIPMAEAEKEAARIRLENAAMRRGAMDAQRTAGADAIAAAAAEEPKPKPKPVDPEDPEEGDEPQDPPPGA